jgi:hypothetical protein
MRVSEETQLGTPSGVHEVRSIFDRTGQLQLHGQANYGEEHSIFILFRVKTRQNIT